MWKCVLSWGWEAIREVFQNLSITSFMKSSLTVSHLNPSWSLSSLCLLYLIHSSSIALISLFISNTVLT